jgi:hypothetical protein
VACYPADLDGYFFPEQNFFQDVWCERREVVVLRSLCDGEYGALTIRKIMSLEIVFEAVSV